MSARIEIPTTPQGAVLSPCGRYRYLLWRSNAQVDLLRRDLGTLLLIMLNPSDADDKEDDPTMGRATSFAWGFGYSRLLVVNLYAYRSPEPMDLLGVEDPVGPDNDRYIEAAIAAADRIVVAWGNGPRGLDLGPRASQVLRRCGRYVDCFRVTKEGQPWHPLYLPGDTELKPYV